MAGYQGTATRRDFVESLSAAIEAERRDLYTTLPGTIVSYDPATQTAQVQPALKMRFGDRELQAPVLQSVPVKHPRGGGYGVHFPLKPGDPVELSFATRARDPFQAEGGAIDGAPGRMHSLSDATAYPGGYPDARPMQGVDGSTFFAGSDDGKRGTRVGEDGTVALVGGPSGSEKLTVTPDGRVDLKGESGDSLLQIIRDFLVVFRDHTNTGAPVDAPFRDAANVLIAKIDGMKA